MLFEHIHILQPDGTILSNAFLQTTGSKITYIGTEPPNQKDTHCYNGRNKLIRAGYINTHCHAAMTLLRSQGTDLPLSRWLEEAIFPIESKIISQQCYAGATLGIAELLRCGVTSFTDMYIFGTPCCQAVIDSGIKANICVGITALDDTAFSDLPYVKETKVIYQQYHNYNDEQLKIDIGLHAEYTSTPQITASAAQFAKEHNLNCHIHLSETQAETEACIHRHGKTPAAYFRDLGLFDNPTTAAHCVFLTEEDKEILAEHHVSVAHCPISNLKLGSGILDLPDLLSHSINVTIGTDGTASNDNLNYIEDIRIAALLQKGVHKDPSLLPVPLLFKIASENGTAAQNRKDTGRLCVGNRADLAVIDLNAINLLPAVSIDSSLIYAAQPSDVVMTMVDGKILYQDGTFPTIDIEKTAYQVKKASDVIYRN